MLTLINMKRSAYAVLMLSNIITTLIRSVHVDQPVNFVDAHCEILQILYMYEALNQYWVIVGPA